MLLKKINLLFLILTLTIIKAEVKINDFEYKINNAYLNMFKFKKDPILLDSNIYHESYKVEFANAYNYINENINIIFKIDTNKINHLKKITYSLEEKISENFKFKKITILSNDCLFNILKNQFITFNLVFIDDNDGNEKLLSIFDLNESLFTEERLRFCFNMINEILINPESIRLLNEKLYNHLNKPNYKNEIVFNDLIEFVSNKYRFWSIVGTEDDKNTIVFFWFKSDINTLSMKLKYNEDTDDFSLAWLILGNLVKEN